jgi:hypothetical protein
MVAYLSEDSSMTHSLVQGKNNSGYQGTPQPDSLRDSSVNHALIAIAQEVAELLKQACPVQVGQIDRVELIDGKRSTSL